jgi:hypothetical protein
MPSGAETNDENQNASDESETTLKEKYRSREEEELPTPQRQRIDDEPSQRNQNGSSVSEKLGIAADLSVNPQVSLQILQKLKNSKSNLEKLLERTQNADILADCHSQIDLLQAEIRAMEAQIAIDNHKKQPIQSPEFLLAQFRELIDDAGSAKYGEVSDALDAGNAPLQPKLKTLNMGAQCYCVFTRERTPSVRIPCHHCTTPLTPHVHARSWQAIRASQ